MSAIKSDFSIQSYAERSELAREIQTECARAERGEQVDLQQTAEKLSDLVQKLNADIKAIKLAPKMSLNVRHAYDLHRAELKGLTARVNSLTAKANGIPAWVKPVASTALGLAGVAATAFILYKSGVFSSQTPSHPTPDSTPISSSTASTSSSNFVPSVSPTVPTPAPAPLQEISLDPVLDPLGNGSFAEEYRGRGEALLAQLKYIPTESIYYGICPKILSTKTNLSSRETRNFYNKCIEQIPLVLTAIENPIDRAYVASQIQSGCLSSGWDAMKDRLVTEIILPFSHSAAHGVVDKDDFALLMGKYGNASAIIAAAQKEGSDLDWLLKGAESIESNVDSNSSDVSNGLSAVQTSVWGASGQILNVVDTQVSEAGKSLGKHLGQKSQIGSALQASPKASLVGLGAAGGSVLGTTGRAVSVFKSAMEAANMARQKIPLPLTGKGVVNRILAYNKKATDVGNRAFQRALCGGIATMTSLYVIGGSALVGAVAVPLAAVGVYGVYSLYTYYNEPATNATQSEEKLLA